VLLTGDGGSKGKIKREDVAMNALTLMEVICSEPSG
jgi:hypothetical protein